MVRRPNRFRATDHGRPAAFVEHGSLRPAVVATNAAGGPDIYGCGTTSARRVWAGYSWSRSENAAVPVIHCVEDDCGLADGGKSVAETDKKG